MKPMKAISAVLVRVSVVAVPQERSRYLDFSSARHLRKFNGIPKEHFELYLKECEWCFNNSEIKSQISILKQLVKGSLV